MEHEEIIAMAREAEISLETMVLLCGVEIQVTASPLSVDELARFAALAAAKERESVAQLIETTEWWKAPKWQSALCPITKGAIADAIRARGQKGGV